MVSPWSTVYYPEVYGLERRKCTSLTDSRAAQVGCMILVAWQLCDVNSSLINGALDVTCIVVARDIVVRSSQWSFSVTDVKALAWALDEKVVGCKVIIKVGSLPGGKLPQSWHTSTPYIPTEVPYYGP